MLYTGLCEIQGSHGFPKLYQIQVVYQKVYHHFLCEMFFSYFERNTAIFRHTHCWSRFCPAKEGATGRFGATLRKVPVDPFLLTPEQKQKLLEAGQIRELRRENMVALFFGWLNQ